MKNILFSLTVLTASCAGAKAQVENSLKDQNPPIAQAEVSSGDGLRVAELSNEYREGSGLGSLHLDPGLSEVAQAFAEDMMNRNYFDHVSPDGGTLSGRLDEARIVYRAAGENIAKGQRDAEAVMAAWMNSPGHRRNIMSGLYGKIGIGRAGPYWVMELTD